MKISPVTGLRGPFGLIYSSSAPLALSRLPPGRHGLPREFIDHNQRNRLMAGAVASFGERGYQGSTIATIVEAAGVSRRTFYLHFDNREDCFLSAYDSVVEWLEREATLALEEATSWSARVEAVTRSVLTRLSEDPRLARLCAVEVLLVGAAARARHWALIERLSTLLRAGREGGAAGAEPQLSFEYVLIGGVVSIVGRHACAGEGDRVAAVVPEVTELLLGAYVRSSA